MCRYTPQNSLITGLYITRSISFNLISTSQGTILVATVITHSILRHGRYSPSNGFIQQCYRYFNFRTNISSGGFRPCLSYLSPTASALHLTGIKEKEIKNTKFTTEVRAGLTTFFTMAYIIAVNVCLLPGLLVLTNTSKASILSDTGGNCVCNAPTNDCLNNTEYTACVQGRSPIAFAMNSTK
jgi:hypothetical protein